MKNNIPQDVNKKLGLQQQAAMNSRELTGISRAIFDHKKEILKLHKMPISSDCAMEIIACEKEFRKTLTEDLRTLVEINCSNCPAGYSRDNCQAKTCPFKSISEILDSRLKQLNQVLPGGV